jgi:Flp pilus assembly protein TadG
MKMTNEKGSISILVMVMLVVLLGSAGAAIDVGVVILDRTELSNALDYAALAGAQELPEKPLKAIQIAKDYLAQNGINPDDVTITVAVDNKSIELLGNRDVQYTFLKVLGLNETTVEAQSKVILGATRSVKGGLRPFAVEDFPYQYGAVVTLKQGAGDGYHGNYGVVALGGSGSSVYEYNAFYGYDGEISIGDEINTEPGNMANVSNQLQTYINDIPHTFETHPRDSERLWTVPLVSTLIVSGRDTVTVTGFAQVFVENIDKKAGKIEINARFVRFVVNGEIDTSLVDRGTYGVKLVN